MHPSLDGESGALDFDLDFVVDHPLPQGVELDALRALIAFVLVREGAGSPWSVAVVLSDDERLRELHRDFMGLDSPTDVMTFPTDEGLAGTRGGDVVVSVERAVEQAADFGLTPSDEVRFLVVHGLLHLCGWDDATSEQRTRMLDRQSELLSFFDGVGDGGRDDLSELKER